VTTVIELDRRCAKPQDLHGIVTVDAAMLALLSKIDRVADARAPVLVRGETGTGKELIARALHTNSKRRNRRFVTIHCAAFPEGMLEAELFGHEAGAFTGAQGRRPGRIATADGGTLFLDEIAEASLEAQAKLLRVIQFGELQRLGADLHETVDIRVVAATHGNLEEAVASGRFRQDLYYRLKVIELEVPPLRDRPADVPMLLDHFLAQRSREYGESLTWSPEARRLLVAHDYPGNVRELEHIVEACASLAVTSELGADLLPQSIRRNGHAVAESFTSFSNDELKRAREAARARVEREFLEGLMEKSCGNVSRAARVSGLPRSYLQRLLARYFLR
jgi:transcriptional regulator with GAF, ATPase, and Fis domain